jgi:hypothetical protein
VRYGRDDKFVWERARNYKVPLLRSSVTLSGPENSSKLLRNVVNVPRFPRMKTKSDAVPIKSRMIFSHVPVPSMPETTALSGVAGECEQKPMAGVS